MIGVAWVRAVRSFRNAVVPVATQVRTRHKGVIYTTSPLTIYLDGGTVAVPAHCLAGYTPVVADVVFVDNCGGDLVVIHKYSS